MQTMATRLEFVFSPLSLDIVLGMLAAGAEGKSLKQLLGFLGHESINRYLKSRLFIIRLGTATWTFLCHDGSISLDVISNSCENLANFIWIHELLPPDILLLALIDHDDDPPSLCIVVNLMEGQELQQRMKLYVSNRGNPDHWLQNGVSRLLRIIPLIIYRIIENDAIDPADGVLQLYSSFLHYCPLNFTFVRDLLAYFYGHLPGNLIFWILNVLDIKKAAADVNDNSDVLFGEDTDEEKKAAK
ncbi:mediator of RNA polymerase II transcription subunit 23 [Tanacetum coccineum]